MLIEKLNYASYNRELMAVYDYNQYVLRFLESRIRI